MSRNDSYRSPLETRYASPQLRAIWSPQRKFSTWRRLWLALAEAQREPGLDITAAQIEELAAHLDDIDFEAAAGYESRLHHDVMAHIHALGDVAPDARSIIHLGATSQFVNCNTELLLIRESLDLIAGRLAGIVDALGTFALEHRALPTLGFTHFQPAQPTTVGKRATLWAYDFALALEDVEHRREALRFRGVKGATGTQASFLALFDGDGEAAEHLRVDQARIGLPGDREPHVGRPTHLLRHQLVEPLDLFPVPVKEGQERGLGAGGPLDAPESQGLQTVLHVLQGHRKVVRPQGRPFADGRRLGRLKMGEPQRRQVTVLSRECCQGVDHLHEPPRDYEEALADEQQVGVAVDELAGGPEVDDGPGLRGDLAQGVDVGHDVMVQTGLVAGRGFEIDVVQVRGKLVNLRLADIQAQLALGLGEREPQTPPCREFPLRRPDCAKLGRCVSGFKG